MGYLDTLVQKAKSQSEPDLSGAAPQMPAQKNMEELKKRVLVDSYGEVKIYRKLDEPLLLYDVPSPHYRGEEKGLIGALMEIALNVITVDAKALTEDEKREKYFQKVLEIIEQTPELKVPANSKEFYAKAVVREMVGYGLIDPLTRDDQLEEIMIIGAGKPVYVYHRKHEMLKTNLVFYEDQDIRDLADRIARAVNRRIDLQVPILDARLPDGTRVNATIAPISLDGTTITLRKFKKDPLTVVDLMSYGTLPSEVAAFLWMACDGMGAYPANILIAGGTASGKTTLLNMLCSFMPNSERIVSIEDTAELNIPVNHWIRLEVRPPSIEGTGEVTMNELVKNSLRMRPDRIIVGEIRGAEGYTMFAAMNTGHRGVMGTVHANSAKETLVRLNSPPISVPTSMLGSLNIILMQNRIHDRRKGTIRRVTELAEMIPAPDLGMPDLQVLYRWDPVRDVLISTGAESFYVQEMCKFTGMNRNDVEKELALRTALLESLVKQGLRGITDVCTVTQNYVNKKKLLV